MKRQAPYSGVHALEVACQDLVEHAVHCIRMAEQADSRSRKELMLIADKWLELAEETLAEIANGRWQEVKFMEPDLQDSFYLRTARCADGRTTSK